MQPSVDSLLRRAARAERRRLLAWVLAGVLVAAGTFALASETTAGIVLVLAAALAIWDERPAPGERLPKPDSVWRCDDELDELPSVAGSAEVHEAWVDTGPRSRSKPRWVLADAGLAVLAHVLA